MTSAKDDHLWLWRWHLSLHHCGFCRSSGQAMDDLLEQSACRGVAAARMVDTIPVLKCLLLQHHFRSTGWMYCLYCMWLRASTPKLQSEEAFLTRAQSHRDLLVCARLFISLEASQTRVLNALSTETARLVQPYQLVNDCRLPAPCSPFLPPIFPAICSTFRLIVVQ